MRDLPFRGNIAADALTEITRQPAYEERAEIAMPDAESMRWSAAALRARCRCAEDAGDRMITVSIRWARVFARQIDVGADALDVEHG